MPLALDPQATFEVVLEYDAGKPPEARPCFVCRALSARVWRSLASAADEVDRLREEKAGGGQALDVVFDKLQSAVVGWHRMVDVEGFEVPFAPESLDLVLTISEAWELLFKILGQSRASGTDLKNSESPSPIDTESSATVDVPDATGPQK